MTFASIAGVVVAAGCLLQSPAARPGSAARSAPDSVLRLIDFASLADLEAGVTCRQFSSSDPEGLGDDHGHFLSLEGKKAVLADMNGPGIVTPFQELFNGKYAPFVEPVATHQGGGFISYFPIPYAKHCRIEVDELAEP